MTLLYVITGGQLLMDKTVFARELLLPNSPMKKLLNTSETIEKKRPKVTKTESVVSINYNDADDLELEENFLEVFRKLKAKYQDKIKGRIVIRITALTSYHVTLDLNTEDGRIVYD